MSFSEQKSDQLDGDTASLGIRDAVFTGVVILKEGTTAARAMEKFCYWAESKVADNPRPFKSLLVENFGGRVTARLVLGAIPDGEMRQRGDLTNLD